ncbi:MAG: aldo/keto reductase [Cytophagales bacterium]|nr:aldo/keto reductase [Cytophagales bacterium]
MNYRTLGKTGLSVSEISLGTWQLGGKWGDPFDHASAAKIVHEAIDQGINFIDTADVYNDGLSEKVIGEVLKERSEDIFVATKCGRQLQPHTNEAYQPGALRGFVEASLKNMQVETLDLVQLHCPPTEVYYRPEIFELFDRLREEGKVRNLGVSVEKIEEAIKAIEFDNVRTVQIIFNMFRHRPTELFFGQARKKNVGIIARVPLASGLLTGKFGATTSFGKDDHRHFNRNGEMFDKGETFSGVDYETGLKAVEQLKAIFSSEDLSKAALKWILMFEEVSCVIPGASNASQQSKNLSALDFPDITEDQKAAIDQIYKTHIKPLVHHLW